MSNRVRLLLNNPAEGNFRADFKSASTWSSKKIARMIAWGELRECEIWPQLHAENQGFAKELPFK